MIIQPFVKEDLEDIKLYLKEHAFDWKGKPQLSSDNYHFYLDILSGEDFEVASSKKYFSEIAENKLR